MEDIKPFEVSAEECNVGISSYCFKIDSSKPQYIGQLYFIKKGSGLGCNINLEYKSSDKQNLAFYLDKLDYGNVFLRWNATLEANGRKWEEQKFEKNQLVMNLPFC